MASINLSGLLFSYFAGTLGKTVVDFETNPSVISSTVSSVSSVLTYMPALNTLWTAGGGLVQAGDYAVSYVEALMEVIPGACGLVAYFVVGRATQSDAAAILAAAAGGAAYGYLNSMETSKDTK